MDAVQLFAQSPRTWRFPEHDPADLEKFKQRREELGIQAVTVHALYLLNLASPKDEFYEKSVTTLRSTMDAACAIEADAVVFHVGSHMGSGFEAALERVVPALRMCLERCSETTWLCMENSAGAGGTIGRSLDELAALYEALDKHERLGVCLDSCHLYVSGYDVTDPAELDGWSPSSTGAIGLDRLRCLHVNDSKAPLGSNLDRHDNIGDGLLGEKLGVFLGTRSCRGSPRCSRSRARTATGPDAEQMEKLRALHARELRSADRREHAERRLADRQLVELGVDAAELFQPALVARLHLRAAERQRRRDRPDARRSRRGSLGSAEQIEVDVGVVHLLHAADVRVPELLERVEERTAALETCAG